MCSRAKFPISYWGQQQGVDIPSVDKGTGQLARLEAAGGKESWCGLRRTVWRCLVNCKMQVAGEGAVFLVTRQVLKELLLLCPGDVDGSVPSAVCNHGNSSSGNVLPEAIQHPEWNN